MFGHLLGWYTIYIHIFGVSCPLTEYCLVHYSLYVQILHLAFSCTSSITACMALQQRATAKLCGVVQRMELQNFGIWRHVHSAGRPSRWASSHILVMAALWNRQAIIFSSTHRSDQRISVRHQALAASDVRVFIITAPPSCHCC